MLEKTKENQENKIYFKNVTLESRLWNEIQQMIIKAYNEHRSFVQIDSVCT